MLGVWDRFRANNVEFPFPQRDIHLPELDDLVEKIGQAFSQKPTDPPDPDP
jgi:small-conductance mechanosensitive channel